ncbi:hypothetical protein [Gordonia sp. NB41Y]|nr:hypothetical protein [Gordonia sp. NB41Y]WLP90397.1 hypothetical protein Q9K23_23280 [Gordonia sp. NB41Y]
MSEFNRGVRSNVGAVTRRRQLGAEVSPAPPTDTPTDTRSRG